MAKNLAWKTEQRWYAPLCPDGTRDDPTDPGAFRVLIEPMSGAEKEALEREHLGAVKGKATNFLARAQGMATAILRKRVLRVEGLSVRNEATGEVKAPKTGGELVEAILAGPAAWSSVLDDILSAIMGESVLRDDLPSSSSSPSASG